MLKIHVHVTAVVLYNCCVYVVVAASCSNMNCADPHSTCLEQPDGAGVCKCKLGYEMVNGECTDINECSSSPCGASVPCLDLVGTYKCVCPTGRVRAGDTCIGMYVYMTVFNSYV